MPRENLSVDLSPAEPIAEELPGLAGLLRGWRARVGRRLDLGKALPQVEVATRVGMSERWYRDLECGGIPRLDTRVLGRLGHWPSGSRGCSPRTRTLFAGD
jgi:hypothetical protein